jgi:NADP-dependent 3-hydroxy acid dehydrogenase YdfG
MRDTLGRNKKQVEEVAEFATANNVDLCTVELDVLADASVNAAIGKIVQENGRLDVVIHNAGHMVFGPAEAFTPEQLAELY